MKCPKCAGMLVASPRGFSDCEECGARHITEELEAEVYRFRDYYIPIRMMGAIDRYLDKGIPPGHFLTAVICNDLVEAVGRADEENLANIPAYVAYFHNEVPGQAWGSRKKMEDWMRSRARKLTKEASSVAVTG